MDEDIRWKQRFQNYKKAFATLKSAVELAESRELTDLEKLGMIRCFDFAFKLAWNVMKDYLEWKGVAGIKGANGAVRQALNNSVIEEKSVWMGMVKDRSLAIYSYDESVVKELAAAIVDSYYYELNAFKDKMDGLA